MLWANQKHIIGRSVPDRPEQVRDQFDQASGLFELLVLFEQRNDILDPWMEGIGGGYLVGDRLRAPVGGFGLGGLF